MTSIETGGAPRDRARSEDHVTEKPELPRPVTPRDSAHVPDDKPLAVEAGRADVEPAPSRMLRGDLGEERLVDLPRDHLAEGMRVVDRVGPR